MVKKVHYMDLPSELDEFSYWVADCGYCVMAIPECLLSTALDAGDLYNYEVPFPVKYVMKKGYRMYNGHLIVEGKYDKNFGLVIPEEYYSF